MLRQLDQRLTDYMLKTYEMPLTQLRGVHTDLADVPRSLPFRTFKNNENYVTQLHEIPTALAQTIEVLKQGEKDGLMPLRSLLEQVPEQCRGIAGEDPFDRRLRQQSHCNPWSNAVGVSSSWSKYLATRPATVVAALSRQFRKLSASLRQSLTWDRGLEMARHGLS